ncbi:hypothetical protein BW730_13915 [Tessaracoccus aquimaris]|uniref:Gfo/Idh/MocA-like oxidoreductase N-terminal domain-containing protein n=1 Tax=Tessaracoccus aquimaris TaxID=1332264 RepID=A0A1Q2CQN6_9ACTN|nr:Gfo/Idh/MocA family oxidoreductase [Tessaracoccus aquimaris]AQP48439.1 hypothetical protein BW730_13915 [Tessaracoccus aquimaris]
MGLRVVIAGAGRFGTLHARVWREGGAEIVGVVDLDPERAATLAAGAVSGDDLAGLLARVPADAVVVATDEPSHAPLALQALAAGCHVLVEKPFAVSAAEAAGLASAAEDASREIVAGHISRFAAPYRQLRTSIADGRVGDLWSLRLRRDFSREWYASFGGRVDPVWESCIHDLDIAISILRQPARRVYAARSAAAGSAAPSVASALIEFTGGVLVTVETAWTIPPGAPQTESGALELPGAIVAEAEAHGSAGVARQRLLSDGFTLWNDASWSPNPFLWPLVDGRVGGAIRAEVDYATDVFAGRRPNDLMPMWEAVWGIDLAEAMTASLATGAPVDLN